MLLTRIVWTAVASTRLADADFRRDLAEYQYANNRDAISGVLLFDAPHLAGCAEGSRTIVNRFLRRLTADPTFGGFQLLSCVEITHRTFGYWNTVAPELAGLPSDELRPVYQRHGTDIPFRPNQLSAAQLFGLLQDLNLMYEDPTRSRVGSASLAGVDTLLDSATKKLPVVPVPVESVS